MLLLPPVREAMDRLSILGAQGNVTTNQSLRDLEAGRGLVAQEPADLQDQERRESLPWLAARGGKLAHARPRCPYLRIGLC